MKIQIRRSVLTFQYEVQTQDEGKATWNTRATFKTEKEAQEYAQQLKGGKAPKVKKTTKKGKK